jgi:hypothetical protein
VRERLAFQLAFKQEDTSRRHDSREEQKEGDEHVMYIQNLCRQMVDQSPVRDTVAQRNLLIARLFGRPFEAKLWTLVASRTEEGVEEGLNFDIFCDKVRYVRRQDETCGLHLNRAADSKSRAAVTARYRSSSDINLP